MLVLCEVDFKWVKICGLIERLSGGGGGGGPSGSFPVRSVPNTAEMDGGQ